MATREQWMAKLREANAAAEAGKPGAIEDFQKIQARIKSLDASGGYDGGAPAGAPAQEPSVMQNILSSINDTSLNTRHAVTERPWQSLTQDLPRSIGSFTSFGANDRLRSLASGTPIEEEVAKTNEADTRLGTWDDAINLGLSAALPFQGAYKYAPKIVEGAEGLAKYGPKIMAAGKSAIGYGAEGAAQSATQALMEGREVGPAALWGAAGGAGGSVGGDAVGSVANIFGKRRPQFKTDDQLFSAAERAHKNTRVGKDLVSRADLVDQIRMADTKGPRGFQELSALTEKDKKVPRAVREGISEIANKPNRGSVLKRGAANILDFGGGWGKLASTKVSGGLFPAASAVLKTSADFADDVNPKQVQKLKAMLLQGSVQGNPAMSPEMKNELRHYLARIGSGAART